MLCLSTVCPDHCSEIILPNNCLSLWGAEFFQYWSEPFDCFTCIRKRYMFRFCWTSCHAFMGSVRSLYWCVVVKLYHTWPASAFFFLVRSPAGACECLQMVVRKWVQCKLYVNCSFQEPQYSFCGDHACFLEDSYISLQRARGDAQVSSRFDH